MDPGFRRDDDGIWRVSRNALLGGPGAITGGAKPHKPAVRVAFWNAPAMALTVGIGRVVGTSI